MKVFLNVLPKNDTAFRPIYNNRNNILNKRI